MLEEHVRNINDGFLFRRELRTQRSVGGDGPHTDGNLLEGEEGTDTRPETEKRGHEMPKGKGTTKKSKKGTSSNGQSTPPRKKSRKGAISCSNGQSSSSDSSDSR